MYQSPYRTVVIWRAIFLSVLVCSVYYVVSVVIARQNTGELKVIASSKVAAISISGDNMNAQLIGKGSADIRVTPGTYYFVATIPGRQTAKVATVQKKHVTSITLDLSKISGLPSVDKINFKNMNSLVEHGISTDQIKYLQQYFFLFKQTAGVVSIAPGSILRPPRDPTKSEFIINFNVSIDGVPYNARLSYSSIVTVRLYLYSSKDNTLLFDSQAVGLHSWW